MIRLGSQDEVVRPPRLGGVLQTRAALRALLAIAAADVVVGAALIPIVDVETILATGPVLLALGTAIVVLGLRRGERPAAALGAAHVGLCATFQSLILLLGWSPSDATVPLGAMSILYAAGVVPTTAWTWHRLSPDRPDPNHCRACGYALVGLPEPRCPECGLAFDPTAVTATVPG